jgi:hypothetical protein
MILKITLGINAQCAECRGTREQLSVCSESKKEPQAEKERGAEYQGSHGPVDEICANGCKIIRITNGHHT